MSNAHFTFQSKLQVKTNETLKASLVFMRNSSDMREQQMKLQWVKQRGAAKNSGKSLVHPRSGTKKLQGTLSSCPLIKTCPFGSRVCGFSSQCIMGDRNPAAAPQLHGSNINLISRRLDQDVDLKSQTWRGVAGGWLASDWSERLSVAVGADRWRAFPLPLRRFGLWVFLLLRQTETTSWEQVWRLSPCRHACFSRLEINGQLQNKKTIYSCIKHFI